MKKITGFIGISFFVFCLLFVSANAYALEAIEVFSGSFEGKLKEKDKYEAIPLLVGFNFDLKPVASRIGIETKGRLSFVLEPFFSVVTDPDPNIEVGSNFLLKYVFPLSEKIQPYAKLGVGALYMTQHTREQATQYNFLPQFGGGFHYFLKDDMALSFEYRYRHLSNASIKAPNAGIDVDMILGGISFFFE